MKYLELVCVSKEEVACFFHQMSDSRNRVIKKHAGTCITHYALHSLSAFRVCRQWTVHKRQVDFFLRKDNAPNGHGHILVNPDKRGTTPGFFPSFCNRGEPSVLLFSFRG